MEISSNGLKVIIRDPRSGLMSERFASLSVVEQVLLSSGEVFCQPEQIRPDRYTCNGIGLTSEFIWTEAEEETVEGEFFPKLGVGLCMQSHTGARFDMWSHYRIIPQRPVIESVSESGVTMSMEIDEVRGMRLKIRRTVSVENNSLSITTEICNTGKRRADFDEYNHNFIALDNFPIGPGYSLDVYCVRSMKELENRVHCLPDRSKDVQDIVSVKNGNVVWKQEMNNLELHLDLAGSEIIAPEGPSWEMQNTENGLSVREIDSFVPSRFVLWGVEHCLCPEVYQHWSVEPGEEKTSTRKWEFTKG